MSDYVTDADLKAWNPYAERVTGKPSQYQRKKPTKAGKAKIKGLEQAHTALPNKNTVMKLDNARRYTRSITAGHAVNKALEIVTQHYAYDLAKHIPHEQRRHGWMTFCRLVQLLYPGYSVRGVSDALTVPGIPARETLNWMFEVCSQDTPHTDKELTETIAKWEQQS